MKKNQKYICRSFLIVLIMAGILNARTARAMELKSQDIAHNQSIPAVHTCDGENISPQLSWSGAPAGTKSFALTCIDPDAPMGVFIHWLVYDIPVSVKDFARGGPLPAGAKEVVNDFGKTSYGGPCPPSGTHRYFLKLYALDTALDFASSPDAAELTADMEGHILGEAQLMGTFSH